jgi:hypothetical protein
LQQRPPLGRQDTPQFSHGLQVIAYVFEHVVTDNRIKRSIVKRKMLDRHLSVDIRA